MRTSDTIIMVLMSAMTTIDLCMTEQKYIKIDQVNGSDTIECIEGNIPCYSLAYAVNQTNGSIVYMLNSSAIAINTEIQFIKREDVSLFGTNQQKTTLICNCNNNSSCGLIFIMSDNIMLSHFCITGCSVKSSFTMRNNDIKQTFLSSITFKMCRNLRINNFSTTDNNGYGLAIVNSGGDIEFFESNFTNNRLRNDDKSYYGGGGLIIISSACGPLPSRSGHCEHVHPGNYSIMKCNFSNNIGSKIHSSYHLSYGGGLNIFLSWTADNNSISVINCTFRKNTSLGGGGAAVTIQEGASNNFVTISKSFFCYNNGSSDSFGGGGGLKIEINSGKNPNGNQLHVDSCHFFENHAMYGGGTTVLGGKSKITVNNVLFYQCHWDQNSAPMSAAVDISPDVSSQDAYSFNTNVTLKNCNITNNKLKSFQKKIKGTGVFLVTKLRVTFAGVICFNHNNNTALFLQSSYIYINSSAQIVFYNNSGIIGGAIRTVGFSGIYYNNNVTINFSNNTAQFQGGAIYSRNSDQHLSFFSHSCFFKPVETMHKRHSIHFNFLNNIAGTGFGNAIYLVSLHACRRFCEQKNDYFDPFSTSHTCLGNFSFGIGIRKEYDITTDIAKFFIKSSQTNPNNYIFKAIPGHLTHIALRTRDDYGEWITNMSTYYANLAAFTKSASISMSTQIINNNHIKIYGEPGATGHIYLSPVSSRGAFLSVHFTLTHCPPGYVWINESQAECLCSAMFTDSYWGISRCNDSNFSGLLSPGFWVGYILNNNKSKESENTLFTSDCPLNYCKPFGMVLELTNQASKSALEKQICAENRYGTLCGQCVNGTSVFYNSNSYQCREEKLCKYGLLLYAIADLLPLTIMFVLLLAFNVSLTSGTAYSVIFMIQQLHALDSITTSGAIQFKHYNFILKGAHIVYSTINMEFFNIDSLSFCLWSGAQTLDIMAMKYVSVLFAMSLVFFFFVFMNKCSSLCKKYRRKSRYSVVHGLTAFLVICYTITTRVTFNILKKGIAYGKGSKHTHALVFLDGETRYFHGNHIKYAIPAIVFLILIVIPPPLILLCDPILLKLEDKLCYLRQPWTKIRIKIKPLMDSFQNCFKDNMRWCAGLFFLYRSIILHLSLVAQNMLQYYNLVEIFLILILTIHSIIQPFTLRKHNVIASLCFCNLILINYSTISFYNNVNSSYIHQTLILLWINAILIYLPIISSVVWFVKIFLCHVKKQRLRGRKIWWWTQCISYEEEDNDVDVIFNRSIMSDYGSTDNESTYPNYNGAKN